MNINDESKYRWYVLGLAAITTSFCTSMPAICMPVLFNEISMDIGLSLVQVGWIWGISLAAGFFTVFPSGLLSDRFGPRRILIFACSVTGLAGASRGFSNSFATLSFTTFLFGLFLGVIPSSIFKMTATWFPSRQLGIATGIITSGMGIGFTLGSMISATLLSPLLGGWRRVLFLYGALSIIIAVLWYITIKEKEQIGGTVKSHRASPREAIYHVLRNRNIWLISLALLGYIGCIEGMCGYIPLYLREFKGWLPASADGTLAVFTGVSTLGAIPISLLSDKIGRRKVFILSITTAALIGIGLLSIAYGIMVWIIIIFVGIGRDALIALTAASTIDSKGIGMKYSGTALGFCQSILRIGPFVSPPIGNSVADNWVGLPFIVWAAFAAFALVCFSLTKETGSAALILKN